MADIAITVDGGTSKRLLTAGKYCDKDILVTATGGQPEPEPPDDGKTRLYITVPANSMPGLPPPRNEVPLYIQQSVANGVTIDWGDGSDPETLPGTGNVNTTHTYQQAGDYVISLDPAEGCELGLGHGSSSYCVLGPTNNNGLVYCNMLQRVVIGSRGVTRIEPSAFYNCYSLASVTIPDGVTSIGNYAFQYCYSLASVTIPDGVTRIGDSVFRYCYSLASVTIPDGVTRIEPSAFYNCYSLASVTIPDGVTRIEPSAFYNCYSLASVTIPDGVTRIEPSAFYNCYSLASVTIPDGVTSIGNYAFAYCYPLASVTIPDGVTSIGNYAFQYCYSLASVTIPDGVTRIGDSVFRYCYSLASVTIPDSVTSIGASAFRSCYGAKEYHLLPTTPPPLLNENAFDGIPSDCIIYVPVGSLEAYQTATNWSTYADQMQEEPA